MVISDATVQVSVYFLKAGIIARADNNPVLVIKQHVLPIVIVIRDMLSLMRLEQQISASARYRLCLALTRASVVFSRRPSICLPCTCV